MPRDDPGPRPDGPDAAPARPAWYDEHNASRVPDLPGAPRPAWDPRPRGLRAALDGLLPYLVAAALYITISVIQPRFMLNWSPGLVLLLLVVWLVPAWWRRRRRGR